MIVATVRYTGRKGEHVRQMPDRERYRFFRRDRSEPATEIESLDHAERFEGLPNYHVEWTNRGELLKRGEAVLERGYQAKRSLVSTLELSLEDSHPSEDQLDETLAEEIERLEEDH